jgi:C1A family cysteine protease
VQLNLSIDQIEAAVRGGNAVCIGVAMSDKFFVPVDGIVNDSVNYIPGMGHAVLAVGIGVHQASKQTYFLIRNSWGPNWGINGHAWLSREYLSNYLRASFAA